MDDRLKALIALKEAVDAGKFTPEPGGAIMPHYRRFTALSGAALPQDVRALDVLAHDAYSGSLDAARALMEAVLPGWWWVKPDGPEAGCIRVVGPDNGDYYPSAVGRNACPARAWLLAILAALIAQEQANG